jgi:phospholipase/carboxylesterase
MPQLDIREAMLEISPEAAPHSLFAPLHYERKYAYPLLVWLHGPSDNETQLKRIMPLISMRNYVAVAPRGTAYTDEKVNGHRHFGWRQNEEETEQAEERVLECIERAGKRFHIHRRRIFIGGYDCGGTMAFRLAVSRPDVFAGVLSICGPFPRGNRPLLRFDQCRNIPLFLAHGRESTEYSANRVCDDLRLFHTAGMSVTLRQYPCGDEVTTQMLSDMDCWMMEQITGLEPQYAEAAVRPSAESN